MRKILENFYFGNITPSERQMTPDSALARAVGRAARCEMQLNEQLNETERTLLAKLVNVQHEVNNITACENFVLGFRLGARIMVECMDEDDGNTQKVTDHA